MMMWFASIIIVRLNNHEDEDTDWIDHDMKDTDGKDYKDADGIDHDLMLAIMIDSIHIIPVQSTHPHDRSNLCLYHHD